ncbi:DUF2169 family type VI secretion system accessory protein [Oceanobacter mangrovi]|uniref:DUF2169 family type VI secretion system accessory protein n=1 Tax=Oceanobacter mangrovi TaxID=2862510 RepID=UPI001C8D0F55|nr:DUF2169 domain-containing protein [Oceanobacter mangrovi]
MQIIKPTSLSLINRCYFFRQHLLAIGVLGFFRLSDSQNRRFVAEQTGWAALAPLLKAGLMLDAGYAKPGGELLLSGHACAPAQQPVRQLDVTVRLATIHKKLTVIGNRHWHGRSLRRASEPEPFEQLPLSYQHSYGGQGFAANPLGKGIIEENRRNQQTGLYDLPNLYLANESNAADKHQRTPASFEPIGSDWPQRSAYQGTFDQQWLDEIHPGFPPDTRPELFYAAAADQHQAGYFLPGDPFQLKGVSARQPELSGQLPPLQARVFVQQAKSNDEQASSRFIEVLTQLDTVWFFPDLDLGLVIYRGQQPISHPDGLDIQQLLLAYEGSTDNPRPAGFYQQQLTQRSDPATAVAHLLHEAPLLPQKNAAEQAELEQLQQQAREQMTDRKRKKLQPQLDNPALSPQARQQLLDSLDDPNEPAPISKALVDMGEVDLSPYLALAKTKTDEALQHQQQHQATAERLKPSLETESRASMKLRVGRVIIPADANQLTKGFLQQASVHSVDELSGSHKLQLAEQLRLNSERQARQLAPTCTVLDKPLPEGGSQQLRQWALTLLQQGDSLAGRDLAGADLQGIDFSDQDLRGTMLERANLSDCRFKQSNLEGAVLTEANLQRTHWQHSRLVKTNFSGCYGHQSQFTECDLSAAMLQEANFTHSRFQQCSLNQINAVQAQLQQARFEQCQSEFGQFLQAQLDSSEWSNCQLSGSNFTQSSMFQTRWHHCQLQRCIMIQLKANGVCFDTVLAEKLQFSNEGDLSQAQLIQSRWKTCGFSKINLQQAALISNVFDQCDFTSSQLSQAQCNDNLFHQCIMRGIQLNHAHLQNDFFSASQLNHANLRTSHWYRTRLSQCDTHHADWRYARIEAMRRQPPAAL